MDDKELFEAATAAEPVEVEEVTTGQPRDDHGRYAPKANEPDAPVAETTAPEPVAQPEPKPETDAHVPSWRLREEREQRETLERRLNDERLEWQRRFAEIQANLPKQQPTPRPDLYENPDAFVEHGVRQVVDPVRGDIAKLRESYSRKWAVKEYGKERVEAAYNALGQGLAQRDPDASATYARAMQSDDPYEDIVAWHQQRTVHTKVGPDPEAWAKNTWLAENLKNPAFQAELLQQIQGSTQSAPQTRNVIQLPKSLNKATGSGVTDSDLDDNDMSDRALFKHAAAPRRR